MTPAGLNPSFDDPDRLSRSSVVTTVFDQLLAAVHRGELEPGQRINDAELAKEYGVSRTPVREALQRLREIGIIEASASRFTRVAVVTPAQTAEAFVVWIALYEALVDEVIATVASDTVDQMEADAGDFLASLDPWDPREMATTNFSFFSRLQGESTNGALQRAINSVVHVIRLGSLHLPDHIDFASLARTQQQLLAAARARDPAAAREALNELRTFRIPQS